MTSISNIFTPLMLVLLAQTGVELWRMRRGWRPMTPFVLCSLSLVFMDLFAVLFIYSASFSDQPGENYTNGLMLLLVVVLGALGFLPAFHRLLLVLKTEFAPPNRSAVAFQAMPALGLLLVFILHARRMLGMGLLLCNG